MLNKDNSETRKQLWCDAWVATASASNCVDHKVASGWADRAVAAFDERFKETTNDE